MGEDSKLKDNARDAKQDSNEGAIYNPIIGTEKEDEGIDIDKFLKKKTLQSQGFWSTLLFFFKQSWKDIRRHKWQFWLGFWSVFVVVLMTLIINTLIDKGPIIFLRLAEGSSGQIDAEITTESNSGEYSSKFTNLTQILSLYDDKYLLSPRKEHFANYALRTGNQTLGTINPSTGLPELTGDEGEEIDFNAFKWKDIYQIDTEQEKTIGWGKQWDFEKLGLGECYIPQAMADLENLKTGDFVFLNFDIRNELSILWDHYKVRSGDPIAWNPYFDYIIAPWKIKGIFSSTGGKFPKSSTEDIILMELSYFYKWVSPYVGIYYTHSSVVAFREFLKGPFARPYDIVSIVLMNFPDPRIDFYKESNYDKVQDNVVTYTNKLTNDLGFFPENVRSYILEELRALSLGLVFIGIIFSIISVLFIIISILLIYSLLMVTVEEKSFEIGIYRMVGLNKVGLVTMVLLKAFFFVWPAIIASFVLWVPTLLIIFRMFLDSSLGTAVTPVPTGLAVLYALLVGIIIPILSSLYPLKIVLSKNLTEALDYSHSKTKAAYVEIVRAQDFDRKPYIIFGMISVAYGLSIYYFLPLALLSLNFGLLLTIFFLILIGMFVGMVLLALNIQRILEILMVYLFLFYETTSMRMLVLKNLIAHKPRNRMTVAIYAMSIGFLIMIVVSYNLEINNSLIEGRIKEGSYLHMISEDGSLLVPSKIEPYLQNVSSLIEYHSWEAFELQSWKPYSLKVDSAFLSDELTLLNFPVSVYGVSPFYTDSLLKKYINIKTQNSTSALGLSQQLYTARGIQGGATGSNVLKKLNVDPNDWTTDYKLNLFTDNWNVFLRLRGIWGSKFMPSKEMSDRENDSGDSDMLISLPTLKKLIADTTNLDEFGFAKVVIKLKEPGNKDHISKVKKALNEASSGINTSIYDASNSGGSFETASYMLDLIFSIIIAFVMFLWFFSLSSSITANMLEQTKEIGVLRAIGLKKSRIYFLYMYECFVLIFSGCMIGVLIGTLIGWTMALQRILFSNLPLTFFFPLNHVLIMFGISIVCAFFATIFPARNILKNEISQIFRSG